MYRRSGYVSVSCELSLSQNVSLCLFFWFVYCFYLLSRTLICWANLGYLSQAANPCCEPAQRPRLMFYRVSSNPVPIPRLRGIFIDRATHSLRSTLMSTNSPLFIASSTNFSTPSDPFYTTRFPPVNRKNTILIPINKCVYSNHLLC